MARSPTGGEPIPLEGMRRLSPQAALQRARALACVRDKQSTQCQGRIHVSLFFDGTGNNWDWNGPFVTGKSRSDKTQRRRNSHSNIVRLWDCAYNEPSNGLFSYYIPGVGTPFEEIGDTGDGFWDGMLGAGAARKGADRINWGIVQVYNAVHQYLTASNLLDGAQAKTIVSNMSSLIAQLGFEDFARRMILRTWEEKLAAVVKGHQRRLREITVSVFGFSRGAAEARAFVHWLYEIARSNNNGCDHVLAGVPLRFNFLGIFDTVASVGISAAVRGAGGKMSWADGDMMSIHPAVEKCAHFVALHEQRVNFPVDLAAGGNVREVLYPGMHSDVGGGYSPGGQGKGMPAWGASPNLSQIPLIDMHYEASKAGVPLRTPDEIRSLPALSKAFSCDKKLIEVYNAWLSTHGIGKGSHRNQIRAHTLQYMKWRGLRLRVGAENMLNQRFFRDADAEDQTDLAKGQTAFAKTITELRRNGHGAVEALANSTAQSVSDVNSLAVAANDTDSIPEAATRLFDDYVHDSLAGFYIGTNTELSLPLFQIAASAGMGMSTPQLIPITRKGTYLRYRTLYEVRGEQASPSCREPARALLTTDG
ncbi:T6SS phospholipase effector Tle1-like catalytic domain-containing protein [Cupriavidus alkaliphilus]|uniref:T6SS phospholipase effector Tle1-like catalytic domain-containing protein n=1 Tax=Cupriavidus alkaliphilus TaxID=942866 RepID=UPI00160B436C|nr:DUF2235 domain-containing protein [Cupriavidus alkaliphilus]MBB3015369.1 hypothetical protein [Cupriavidus alkaliphilus]